MIEIVHKDGKPKKPSQSVMMIRSSESKSVKDPIVTKETSLIDEGSADKLIMPNNKPDVVVEKKSSSDVVAKQEKPKVIVPGITFSDDDLPLEGTEHNRALYLTVKCEDSVVTRVLVDNGSSANICPLSTLNKLKVDDERIHKNSICVRGFDGGGKDSVGDIMLELTIGPVEFSMEFQVLDVAVSYNLLLGRPWIHVGKAVPSSLHHMVKFEWDRQEIIVHGDENLCAFNDTSIPFIEAEEDNGPWVYQN
ncbi:PREDICTED: uncharacterized protein LOC109209823 [Nicotiana attenuata]|uniref:uncharacterized protein LOC109209823 n=1 Tax=Nicotiana attenuata TaxID=49451 RepID=UPI000904D9ED|nr:PREDICTED: uncharacterized protein LOC109209823 [Nicotiana attenuata]